MSRFWSAFALTLLAVVLSACGCGGRRDARPAPKLQRDYSLPVTSFDLAVLVDQSGSMLRTDPTARRSDVAAFLLESLGALEAPPQRPNRAVVVHFGSAACSPRAPKDCGQLIDLRDDAATRQRVRDVAAHPSPLASDNTNIAEALQRAREALRAGARAAGSVRQIVVVLTDGLPDPDGRTQARDLPAQFARIQTVWRELAAGGDAQLHVLGLDAPGTTFTERIVQSWREVAARPDHSDVNVARVESLDAMLDQGARLIADLTGPGGSAPRSLQQPIKLDVDPWRARLDVWVLGPGLDPFPAITRPDGSVLPPAGARLVRGQEFALLRVSDPASGTWRIAAASHPATRVLARAVPHELRLVSPHSVAEGDTRPLIAAFQRVDGSAIKDPAGSRIPLSFRATVRSPKAENALETGFRPDDGGRFVSEAVVPFTRSGRWTVDLTVLSEAGAGGGRGSRWSSPAVIEVARRPRLALAQETARVWRWPFQCHFQLQARVVEGANARVLARAELERLGTLGDLLLLDGEGYLAYDEGSGSFVRALSCPRGKDSWTGTLVLMTGANRKEFVPESYRVGARVATSALYWLVIGLLALAAVYVLGVLLTAARGGKPCNVKLEVTNPDGKAMPVWSSGYPWNTNPALPRAFTRFVAGSSLSQGPTVCVYCGGRLGVALRLGAGKLVLTRERREGALDGYKFKLVS